MHIEGFIELLFVDSELGLETDYRILQRIINFCFFGLIMTNASDNLYFASTHEWARELDNDIIEVGISDFAQQALGDVVYLEMPEVGKSVSATDECCSVESVKAASGIYAPVSGEIVAVNDQLDEDPELLNESPYQDGWIFRIQASDLSELENLMNEQAYLAQVED